MYLIPRNVVARFQFFPGFGWFELGAVAAGGALGAALWFLFGLVGTPYMLRVALLVCPIGAAAVLTRQGPDGMSLYGLLRRFRAWRREQRTYLYIAGRGQCP